MKSRDEELAPMKRSSRRKAPGAPPNCILDIGEQRLPAVIVEERGGTMHVLVQGSPQFWVEDSGLLTTPEGELSVRVFNIVRVEAEEDEVAGSIPAFRIGLERLGMVAHESDELGDDDDHQAASADQDEDEPRRKRKKVSLSGPMALLAVVAALICAGVAWQHHASPFAAGSDGSPDSSNSTNPPMPAPEQLSAANAVPAEIIKLPGVEPFLQAEVAQKLELSPEQAGACQRLNNTTQEAIEDLEKYWGSSNRWELAQRKNILLEASRQEALQILSDKQRKQWDEIAH